MKTQDWGNLSLILQEFNASKKHRMDLLDLESVNNPNNNEKYIRKLIYSNKLFDLVDAKVK
jgi:hypothetical protein